MGNDMSYIHMNEAIKEFGKTRQTFYNYINKGQIATKKIHNKTYLSVRDIKRVLGSYIGEQPSGSNEQADTGQQYDNPTLLFLNDQINILEKKIQNIPNNFSLYTQQSSTESKQYTDSIYMKLQGYIKNVQDYIETTQKSVRITQKKQQFALGYFAIVLLNVVILLFLL